MAEDSCKLPQNRVALTFITLLEARDLAVETFQHSRYSCGWIAGQLQLRNVRWQYAEFAPGFYPNTSGPLPPLQTLEQEAENFWAKPTGVRVDWENGTASKPVYYCANGKALMYEINVFGIRLVREDIVFRLAQLPRRLVGEAPVSVDPPSAEASSEGQHEEQQPQAQPLLDRLPPEIRDSLTDAERNIVRHLGEIWPLDDGNPKRRRTETFSQLNQRRVSFSTSVYERALRKMEPFWNGM